MMQLHAKRRWLPVAPLIALAVFKSTSLAAQDFPGIDLQISGQAVPVYTRADPIPGGTRLSELRVVQPVLMLDASSFGGRLQFHATANLEGWTIEKGELAPGDWGEGFIDRRHPHTYVHELMLSGRDLLGRLDGPVSISLSGGKGFVAFGSDDPMSRPPLRYPVNHHFSQILERAVGILGVAWGPVMIEGSLFNGDEPERPGQWPLWSRFGDSWALRATLMPIDGVELQVSRADVHSPEHRPGQGPDQTKWNLSGRWQRDIAGLPVYAMIEYARTEEASGFFQYHSWLGEAQVQKSRHRAYYRFERTERPEEARLIDPFRTQRPHLDNSILGISRWTVNTGGYGFTLIRTRSGLNIEPFVEFSRSRVKALSGLFDPQTLFGDDTIWSGSVGVRMVWRMLGHRMGRYGVAAPKTHLMHDMQM
jgi:hypothetical protein